MQITASPADATQFNADLLQAQREALNALREVMMESAEAVFAPPAADSKTPEARRHAAAQVRRLSLRLRAATAVLRIKPAQSDERYAAVTAQAPSTHPPKRVPDENAEMLTSALAALQQTGRGFSDSLAALAPPLAPPLAPLACAPSAAISPRALFHMAGASPPALNPARLSSSPPSARA